MDFKEILEQWESSPEGQKAAEDSRFSHVLKEKEAGSRPSTPPGTHTVYHSGHASLVQLKNLRPQAELDLHGVTAEEAQRMVADFLRESLNNKLVKVRIVHGRGLHSPDGRSVLKDVVLRTLKASPYVRATGTPAPVDGGSGAVWVILQRGKAEPVAR